MDLVFFGTPQFAVPTLERLIESGFHVRLVLTQPDRPRGRGLEVAPSPVKQRALELGLAVAQPDKVKTNDALREQLAALTPAAIIVVGYGRILPRWIIDLPRYGCINLHASLLPKYRGAAPVQWAIARGETLTGVTTMRIDEGLDTGDILLQQKAAISPDDTTLTLEPRLAAIGAELMVQTLRGLSAGTIAPLPQDSKAASLAPLLKKGDGRIDFAWTAGEIHNRLRGFQPWPGVFTSFREKVLFFRSARPVSLEEAPPAPGEVAVRGNRLLVGCGGGTALEVLELQPEGKKRLAAGDFLHGYRLRGGERLGDEAR
ncbi:MAG: methionyl-tRNA formyltransferase [Terriglobales bacterium]